MKNIFVSTVFIATITAVGSSGAQSQERAVLQGQVIDAKSRDAVEGADVTIVSSNASAHSTADGRFRIENAPAGPLTLHVRRLGYASTTLVVTVSTRDHIVIALTRAARDLDAVVVTAARREEKLKDAVSTMELVTRETIAASGATDIASVLIQQTGVQFNGGHPSGSSVSLEGMSDQRVLVLVDGLPLYGRISGGMDLTRIPANIVERVEIVKGPQSTLYGSEAMGGVINIITRRAAPSTSDVELAQTAGNNRRSSTDVLGTIGRGDLSGTAALGHQYVERAPGIAGTVGTLTDRVSGLAGARWNATSALAFDANTLVLNDRQRWPSGTLYQFADDDQVNGRVGASYADAQQSLTTTLSISQLDHLSRASQFTLPIAGTGDSQKQRSEEANVLYSRHAGMVTLDGGAVARHEFISSSDGRIAGGSRTLDSAEPYAQAEISGDRWSVMPGLRMSWNQQWGSYLSPRLAARYRVDPALTLRASVGRGFRSPDFKEMYLDFSNDAASYAVHGNPSLRPESSENASVGAEWDGSRIYARGTAFVNQLHDFIETQPLPASGSFAQYTYGNISRGSTRGLELTTGANVGVLHTEAAYAYLATKDESTGGALLGQPAHSGRLLLRSPLAFGLHMDATEIITGRTPMQRADDGTITSSRDAFARLDLRLSRALLRRYEISAGATNVFDARPAAWADATDRSVYVSVRWALHPTFE